MDKKLFSEYILDHKPGLFLSRILYSLFRRIGLDEGMKEKLRRLSREGSVVYAIKYRGRLDYLMYHYNFRMKRLPYPKLAFDCNMSLFLPLRTFFKNTLAKIFHLFKHGELPDPHKLGFYKDAVKDAVTSLTFLVDPKHFSEHFVHARKDLLHLLLETQKEMERPIFIVPQLVLYKKTPEREIQTLGGILFGFKEQPGVLRKTVLFFRHHRRAFIDFGEPVNLQEYIQGFPDEKPLGESAVALREELVDRIDAQKRIILGPIMKSRQQLKEIVLRDQGIRTYIRRTTERSERQALQLRKKAGEYFDEIAADFNIAYIHFFNLALKWFFNKLFTGIDVDNEGLARVREWARRGPLVYVPSHKSHIDYLVLNYILFHHNMHIPRIAAGKNLAFWPMGHMFRKSGAFFIRRTFQGARLYREVFNRYIKALIEEGHPLEFFIEGGRSRSGKLILPKIGFLTILLKAYEEGYCRDLVFVPASISYDRILEEKSYLKEMAGGEKEKENFLQILRARHFLKGRYGKIYIRFSEPVSLQEYLRDQIKEEEKTHKQLAFHLIRSINRVTLVTPLSVVASAILTVHRGGFTVSELTETASEYIDFLKKIHAPMASTLDSPRESTEETLALLQSWKIVDSLEVVEDEESFYFVDDEKKVELEFYKNSIVHLFLNHSFTALSLLHSTEEVLTPEGIVSDFSFLCDLFNKEFVTDFDGDSLDEILKVLADYEDAGLIQKETAGGFRVTRTGFMKLPAWARFTKTYLESYWSVVQYLLHKETGGGKKKDDLKRLKFMGMRFFKLGKIDHLESISQITFRNALEHFTREGLGRPTTRQDSQGRPQGHTDEWTATSNRLYDMLTLQ